MGKHGGNSDADTKPTPKNEPKHGGKGRWSAILSFIALTAALLIGGGAVAAHASVGTGDQWSDTGSGEFPNAWGGNQAGNLVRVNIGQTPNNDFTLIGAGNGNYELWSAPGSGSVVNCISDNGNNSGDAKAGLNNCANGTPWGALFTISSCSVSGQPGFYFRNNHWGGYLQAQGNQGQQVYLNFASAHCMVDLNPA